MLGLILNGGERKVAQSLLTQIAMRQLSAQLFITFVHLQIPVIHFVQGSFNSDHEKGWLHKIKKHKIEDMFRGLAGRNFLSDIF